MINTWQRMFLASALICCCSGAAQNKIKKQPYKKMNKSSNEGILLYNKKPETIYIYKHTFEREELDGDIKSVTINKAYDDLPEKIYALYQLHMDYYIFNENAFEGSSTKVKDEYKEAEKIFRKHVLEKKEEDKYKSRYNNVYIIASNKDDDFKEFYAPKKDIVSVLNNYFSEKTKAKKNNILPKKHI